VDRLIALVSLRLRLEVRAFARSRGRALGLALAAPGLLLFSGLGTLAVFWGVRALERTSPGALLPVLSLVATLAAAFWALSPVLTGVAFSETHDLGRLVHFPVSQGVLVTSSLVANLAQPFVLADLPMALALAGAVSRERPLAFPLALLAVLSSLVLVLAAAHLVGLVLHGLSRNRRLHDLSLVLAVSLGFVVSVLPFLLFASRAGRTLRGALGVLVGSDLLRVSPFAWGVRAAVHAGRGEAGAFLAALGGSLLATALLVALSARLTGRIYRGELRVSLPGADLRRARMVFASSLGALFEKDMRVSWRDPTLKVGLFLGPALLLALVFFSQARVGVPGGSGLLVLATFLGLAAVGSNAFGFERRGLQLLLSFPVERWRILVAKNLLNLGLRLPGFLMLGVLGLVTSPAHLPAAATILFCGTLLAAGVDNYSSILFPVPVPAPGANPHGSASGARGLGYVFLGMVFFLAAVVAAVPFVFLAWLPLLLRRPWLGALTLPLAAAGAAAVYALLVAGAARLLARREPDLLEQVLGEA
jgi:hypothetical protein